MKRRNKTTILLMFIIHINLFAQYPLVRNFTRIEYQGGKQNWCITQDKDNKMYFANNEGLLEFDSNSWELYPISNYTNIRSIMYEESSHKIYAGAFNEFGYYLYDNHTLKLKYHTLSDRIPLHEHNFNEVWNICENGKDIYFQSDKKIFRYNPNGKIDIYPFQYKIDKTACIYNTYIITNSEEGVWTLNQGMLLKLPNSNILKGKKVVSILPFEGTKILFATALDGLFLFDGEKVAPYITDLNDFLKEHQIFCATIRNNKIAFGTVLKGLVIKDMDTGTNTYINTYSGLQNNTILSIKFDNDNNLWLGLDKGIDYVLIDSPIKNLFNTNNLYGSGYVSLIKNNSLYLGTNQGLYITPYPAPNTPNPLQLKLIHHMQSQVWCLTEIDNKIFCGNDHGTFIITENKATQLPAIDGTWILKKLIKRPEYILGCSYRGFFILKKDNGEWKFSHFIKGFSESGGMIEEDSNGDIWFVHWMKGIYRLKLNASVDKFIKIDLYDEKKGLPYHQNNTISKIGNNLIFSSEGIAYKYDSHTDRMVTFNPINKLVKHQSVSLRIHEMPNRDIWIISRLFIAFASYQSENNYIVDSISYKGLLDKMIVGFENFNPIDNNKVLLSTEDGFSYIDTGKKQVINKKPKVLIKNLFSINDKDTLLYSRNENGAQIPECNISYKLNSLRFEFVLPEYQDKQAVEYSYTLEKYDEKWSTYSPANAKEYTKLKAGNYVFKIKSYNKIDGSISEASLKVTILPPWYASNIAYIIYIIITLLIIYIGWKYFNKKYQYAAQKIRTEKEKQLKEQKEKFLAEAKEKEKEIIELKNQKLEYDLKHKSQELADSTMNLIRKNEVLSEISNDIINISEDIKKEEGITVSYRKLLIILDNIKKNIAHDSDWKKFEQNFDIVYDNYLKRLSEQFPTLNINDKKLCAYLKMDLSSKDISPLLNMSVRSVETARYRLRKKLGLNRESNLTDFLQKL